MGYPKKHRGRRKMGSKKEELERKIRRNTFQCIKFYPVKSIIIWIFIIPFIGINASLSLNN